MAKNSYSTSRVRRFVKNLERQGCRVRETKSGWFIYFPDGKTTMNAHSTISDQKAVRAMRAAVLRAGLTWPGI